MERHKKGVQWCITDLFIVQSLNGIRGGIVIASQETIEQVSLLVNLLVIAGQVLSTNYLTDFGEERRLWSGQILPE